MATKKKAGAYATLVIIICFFVNFVANYPQYQLSPMAPQIMGEMGLSGTQFASLFSSAMIPGILLSLVAGLVCDKIGIRKGIGAAAIISAAAVVCRIFVGSYAGLFTCMLLSGVIATFFNSNVGKVVGTYYPPEKIGTMIGVAMAGSTGAQLIGMSTTAMMPSLKFAYTIAAVLSVAVAVAWILFVRDKAPDADAPQMPQMEQLSLGASVKKVLGNKYIWFVGLVSGLILAANMMLNTFLPTVLQTAKGMSAESAGATASIVTMGSFIGTLLIPIISAKVGKMKPVVLACSIVAAAGAAFAWRAPQGAAMMAALFCTGFSCSGVITMMVGIPVMLEGVGPMFAGTAGGVVATMQLLCGVVLPSYVVSPMFEGNFNALFLAGGVFGLLAAVVSLLLPEVYGKKSN